jgi:hypothetical protein
MGNMFIGESKYEQILLDLLLAYSPKTSGIVDDYQWARFSRPATMGHIHQNRVVKRPSEPSAIHHLKLCASTDMKGDLTAHVCLFPGVDFELGVQ